MGTKQTYSVEEIREIFVTTRNQTYKLIQQNVFHSVRVGRLIRISKPSFDNWLHNTNEGS